MEKHLVICIGRQFGSGGREIGLGLAKKLGIRFYDKEILKKAAEESGIVEELFEKADEKPTNSFLYSLSMGTHGQAMNFTNYNDYLTNDKLFLFQSNTIRDMAEKDSCVIIGRCADYILRGRKDMLSVFIHAPMELRIQRISRVRNVEEDAARSLIKKTDRQRANYYNFYADNDWGAADSYDVAINSGKLGVENPLRFSPVFVNTCKLLQKPHGKSHAVFDFSAIKKFIPMAAGRGRPAEKLYRSPKPDVQRAVAVRKAACGNQAGGRFGRARSLRLAQHIVQPEGREQKPCKPRLHYTRPAAV